MDHAAAGLTEPEETPPEVHFPGLRSVARRALPNLIEATVVPTVLFLVLLSHVGLKAAALSSLAWSLLAFGRRLLLRKRVSGLLMLGMLGLAGRTVAVLISGSPIVYFLQPIATTAVIGLVFLTSTLTSSPLVHRLSGDFCPLPGHVTDRPGVRSLFRRLTLLWALVNIGNASVTCWLLFTQPLAQFVALKQVAAMSLTWSAVAVTVTWSVHVARREGLRVRRPHAPAMAFA